MKKKMVSLAACFLMGLMALSTGCSSSGDSGGDPSPDPQSVGSLYSFDLRGIAPAPEADPGVTVAWSAPDDDGGTVRIHPNPDNSYGFSGTVDTDSGQITISQGSGCDVYDLTDPLIFGPASFRILVQETIMLAADGPPTSGVIQIEELDEGNFAIRITIGAGSKEILVEFDQYGDGHFERTEEYTFDEFEDLWDSELPEQRLAVFGLNALEFLLNQVNLVEVAIDWIGEHESDLMTEPYADTGDSFEEAGLTRPAGISYDEGPFAAGWIDASNNSELGPGDTFEFIFKEVWLNDTASDDDLILDGYVSLKGFTEVVTDGQTELIGFEPFSEGPGGVYLTDFKEMFTHTEEGAVFIDTTFTINGAFAILFAAQ